MIKDILSRAKTIAIVGLSDDPARPSWHVAKFLKEKGYKIIPISPKCSQVLGEKSYTSIPDVPDEIIIDIVNIFRKSNLVIPHVRNAIKRGIKTIWMQEGVINNEAKKLGNHSNAKIIMDTCIAKSHYQLFQY